MSEPITIRRFSKRYVEDNDKSLFNVNNRWANDDKQEPDDYYDRLKRTETGRWVNLLKPDCVHHLDLDREDTEWMLQALNSYAVLVMMGTDELQAASTVTRLFKEQLDKTSSKHANEFPKGSWFVRVERVSLKSGVHGTGPYDNLKKIIQSIITSKLGHECISMNDNLDRFRIYLFPWVTIQHEFRVFIYQNRVSAISTQHYLEIDKQLADRTDDYIVANIVNKIVEYFNKELRDKLAAIVGPDYTMDIGILDDGSVYFIEPNCFGANYAAGSSLFHWSNDQDVLCSTDGIEFRFADRE